jgi:hypothetical protein
MLTTNLDIGTRGVEPEAIGRQFGSILKSAIEPFVLRNRAHNYKRCKLLRVTDFSTLAEDTFDAVV